MTTNRAKGMKAEREFEKILINASYTTQRVKGSTKFNKNVDFFGLWDIIAFDINNWVLVQVKSDYRKKTEKELKDWFKIHLPPKTIAIYAIRNKGKRKDRWRLVYIGNTAFDLYELSERIKMDEWNRELIEEATK